MDIGACPHDVRYSAGPMAFFLPAAERAFGVSLAANTDAKYFFPPQSPIEFLFALDRAHRTRISYF
jgi:hypothetical protein